MNVTRPPASITSEMQSIVACSVVWTSFFLNPVRSAISAVSSRLFILHIFCVNYLEDLSLTHRTPPFSSELFIKNNFPAWFVTEKPWRYFPWGFMEKRVLDMWLSRVHPLSFLTLDSIRASSRWLGTRHPGGHGEWPVLMAFRISIGRGRLFPCP